MISSPNYPKESYMKEPEVKRVKIGRIRDSAVHWTREYSDKDIESMSASFDIIGQEHPITV